MAYNEILGNRIRTSIGRSKGITEKKMFGGLAFLVDGKMFCGIVDDKLMVRVWPDQYEKALSKPHTSEMDFTGKPMRGYIFVNKKGLIHEKDIAYWIEAGLSFTKSVKKK